MLYNRRMLEKSSQKNKVLRFYQSEELGLFVIFMIVVLSAIGGFLYEEIFYRIDLGKLVKRGICLGPWITIYGAGGFLLMSTTLKIRNALVVFLVSFFVCGILEFLAGFLILHIFHVRLWDYNTEIWNFGNISGYVCLRSCLFFAFAGIFQKYALIPFIKFAAGKVSKIAFNSVSAVLFTAFVADSLASAVVRILEK